MPRHFHLAPDFRNLAVAVDEEGGAFDAHVFLAVHAFFYPHAIGFAGSPFGIGGKHEGQFVLLFELIVARHTVLRQADDDGLSTGKIGVHIAELAGFGGAAGGIVFRVEIEHHRLALQRAEGHGAIAIGRQSEIGGLGANIEAHGRASPSGGAGRWAGASIKSVNRRRTRVAASLISCSRAEKSRTPAA